MSGAERTTVTGTFAVTFDDLVKRIAAAVADELERRGVGIHPHVGDDRGSEDFDSAEMPPRGVPPRTNLDDAEGGGTR